MNSGQVLVIAAGIIIVAVIVLILVGIPQPPLHPGGGARGTVGLQHFLRSRSDPIREQISRRSMTSTRILSGPQYIKESDYRLTVTGLTNTTDVYTYKRSAGTVPD